MKKSKFVSFLFCLFFTSCFKGKKDILIETNQVEETVEIAETEEEKKSLEDYKNQFISHEVSDFLQDNSLIKVEKIRDFFNPDTYYGYSKISNVSTQNDVTLYNMTKLFCMERIGVIPTETEIQVIGHLQRNHRINDIDYLLVKQDKNNLYDGWVSEEELMFHVKENDLYLFPTVINISPDNEYISCVSNINEIDSIVISNKQGDKVIHIPFNTIEIPEQYKNDYVDYDFLGWSTNNNLIWYAAKEDFPTPLTYVVIDYFEGTYKVIPAISSSNFLINYDTGDCIFSKREFSYGIDPGEDETAKKLEKIYYANVYNQKEEFVISTVLVEKSTSLIKYGPNNELLYLNENNEYIEYKPNW